MGGLWLGGLGGLSDPGVSQAIDRSLTTSQQQIELNLRVRDLEHQVQRLALLNQALWELLRERLGVMDTDLEVLARNIDLRDGVEDGRITVTGLECPACGRVSSSKHWKCLYCGQVFEKPIMG